MNKKPLKKIYKFNNKIFNLINKIKLIVKILSFNMIIRSKMNKIIRRIYIMK